MERLTDKGHIYHSLDLMECGIFEMVNKLREYEDAEEQGLLLRLPCKVGDTIYKIPSKATFKLNVLKCCDELNKIYEQKVSRIEVSQHLIWYVTEEGFDGVRSDNYKKTWFITREEAEAALEKMKGEEHE